MVCFILIFVVRKKADVKTFLIRAISGRYSQTLSRIKMEGDGIYVAIALAPGLIFSIIPNPSGSEPPCPSS